MCPHSFLTSALYDGEWSGSSVGCFTAWKNRRFPLGWVCPRTCRDLVWGTKKSLAPVGNRNHGGKAHSLAGGSTALTEVVDGFMIRPDIVFYIPSRACRHHHWKAKYRFCCAAVFFVKKMTLLYVAFYIEDRVTQNVRTRFGWRSKLTVT
jgi:hypothetical protein